MLENEQDKAKKESDLNPESIEETKQDSMNLENSEAEDKVETAPSEEEPTAEKEGQRTDSNSEKIEETEQDSMNLEKSETEEQVETATSEESTVEKEGQQTDSNSESIEETKQDSMNLENSEADEKVETKASEEKPTVEKEGEQKESKIVKSESESIDSESIQEQKEEIPKTENKNNDSQKSDGEIQDNESLASSDDEEEEDEDSEVGDEYHGILVKAYDEMNIDALGEELDRLLKAHEVKEIRQHVRDIKSEFDSQFDSEREDKKRIFLEEGGSIIDFSYSTEAERKFNKLYFDYKEKRDNFYKSVRKNLQDNLEYRLAIIEELKSITGVGTDMSANFKAFRALQDRWRKAGPVPSNDYKDTWNTYHHHVERFYSFLHLDREFREMDYKHNLEQKLKMIARAEELTEEENVNRAFRELQNLHRMWKEEVGPVSQEYSDAIWDKFSAATRKIHDNRRAYFDELDKQREKHLEIKQYIISKIEDLGSEDITSHGQAQNKIKVFHKLRDEFFKAGRVPRDDNQPTWDAFKAALRGFNHQKNEFYRKRKEEHIDNLEKKLELIKIAEEHKDSEDFEYVTPLIKKIQADWKNIGFVQRSKSDKIWKKFKKACNHYFDRLHALKDEKQKEDMQAYHKKEELLKEISELTLTQNREEDLPKIKEAIEAWKNIGRVPNNKRSIEGKFNKALDKLFKELDLNRKEAEMLKYENHLESLKDDGDEGIRREASFLYKKIDQSTNEIRQLETNLQFFGNPDRNNPLMKSTFKNIDQLKQQLKIWKSKLEKIKRL